MNFEQPPPYQSGPTAPTYPGQVPPQGYPPQVNMMQPNAGYSGYPPPPVGGAAPYPGPGQPPYQGYPGQPQYGWQGGPQPGPVYGEPPKNTGERSQEPKSHAVFIQPEMI